MQTTLNEIRSHHPCKDGWHKLLKHLHKIEADDEPISLMTILESNGIKDAIWCLRCFDYIDYCLFNAEVAESVLHIFEDKYPSDMRPRECIQAIRDFKLTRSDAAADAAAAARDAARAAAYAAAARDAANAAYAAYAANAANAANAHAYAAARADARAAAYAARQQKWSEINKIFRRHFS